MSAAAAVRPISDDEHHAFLRTQRRASFLQTPGWAAVKSDWRAESVGWDDGTGLSGAALVLYRRLPRLRRSLAYVPEGPILDWDADDVRDRLDSLVDHARAQGAFAVRIGPPVAARAWEARTVKTALAEPSVHRLEQLEPDERTPSGLRVRRVLESAGWRPPPDERGFAAGQPRHVFQLPLVGRSEQDVLAGMNQMWRRNIRKAERAGVEVVVGAVDDLAAFHRVYCETAERDSFTPRPLAYFRRMYDALSGDASSRITLYLARRQGDVLAAAIAVGVGAHVWYSYGASTTRSRDVCASHAVQWRMVTDALAAGAAVYDMRGITAALDADDPHVGLTRFKLGTGGRAVELVGEWTLPISRPLTAAFDRYVRRRAGG